MVLAWWRVRGFWLPHKCGVPKAGGPPHSCGRTGVREETLLESGWLRRASPRFTAHRLSWARIRRASGARGRVIWHAFCKAVQPFSPGAGSDCRFRIADFEGGGLGLVFMVEWLFHLLFCARVRHRISLLM